MAGRGVETKYKEEYAEQTYKLCLLGATDKDLANFFNVTEQTINNWKNIHEDFFESIKKGKEIADAEIASKLYHRAKGYEHPEVITASFQGQITDTMEVVKHYAPDPTSMIFWLKNRQPKKWRDKQEFETKNENVNTNIDIDYDSMSLEDALKLKEILDKNKKDKDKHE